MNLLALATLVAVITRIQTKEEVSLEVRNWARSRTYFWSRKLAYFLTCSFCFSVWTSAWLTFFLYRYEPFLLVQAGSSLELWAAVTLGSLVGIANAELVVYELATAYLARLRTLAKVDETNVEFGALQVKEARMRTEEFERIRKEQELHAKLHVQGFGAGGVQ